MEWISVEDKLPNDGEQVIVYLGNYGQPNKFDIVKFNKGISLEERGRMESGELPIKTTMLVNFRNGVPKYTEYPRYDVYGSEDEHGNNKKPYCWSNPPMNYFGQYVTHWMPLPKEPNNESNEQ